MADNTTLPGTGESIASDDIGGVKYQRVKISVGADGAAADLAPGQAAMANSLPVAIANNQSAVPVSAASLPLPTGASTAALQGGGLPAALGTGGGLKVDGSGTALPVSLASVPSHAVTNAGTFVVQVNAALPAGELHVGEVTANHLAIIAGAVTRPNDTTAYAAGDAITTSTSAPAIITFASVNRVSGGAGTITRAVLADSANQTTKGNFELWLFDTAPTAPNDNAALAISDAEALTVLGVIPFNLTYVGNAGAGTNGNCTYQTDAANLDFVATARDIYGLLVVRNAYTPIAQEVFTVRLFVDQR